MSSKLDLASKRVKIENGPLAPIPVKLTTGPIYSFQIRGIMLPIQWDRADATKANGWAITFHIPYVMHGATHYMSSITSFFDTDYTLPAGAVAYLAFFEGDARFITEVPTRVERYIVGSNEQSIASSVIPCTFGTHTLVLALEDLTTFNTSFKLDNCIGFLNWDPAYQFPVLIGFQ
jgi:hypothetical protein